MKERVFLIGVFLSIMGVFIAPMSAFAATPTGSGLTTSPISSNLHVEPGKSISTTLTVQNDSSTPLEVQLSLQTFKPYGTNGQAQVMPPKPNSAYINWVHFSQDSLLAQPFVTNKIQMTISPPKTAALEYYYAVIVKPSIPPNALHKNSTSLKGYNAILVLLDVTSANAKPMLTVSKFSSSHGLYEYLPASFSITAQNPGNVFLVPTGDIYISKNKDLSDPIATLPINIAQGNVIPGAPRVFTADWSDGFPKFVNKTIGGQPVLDKSGHPIQQLKWNFADANKFRFGHYYAKMAFVYNNGSRDVPIYATISFWVIPWKLGSLVLLVILLCLTGVYMLGRKVAARTAALSQKMRGKNTPKGPNEN